MLECQKSQLECLDLDVWFAFRCVDGDRVEHSPGLVKMSKPFSSAFVYMYLFF